MWHVSGERVMDTWFAAGGLKEIDRLEDKGVDWRITLN
jgi:hypothetical protein